MLPDMADPLARFRLDGRVALVCGGTGGIGLPIAQALAAAGASVAVVGRDGGRTRAAAARVGPEALAIAADVIRREEADRAIAETVARFGRLDVLVNGVGGGGTGILAPAEEYPEEKWRWIMELNLTSTLWTSAAAARQMIERGAGGAILNVSSVRGQLALRAGYSSYVAAKGALNMLTRQHATEWAPHRIRVNAISPTFVRTAQVADMLANRDFYEGLVARIPLGRIAEPDDLVGAALFLCSDASAFVTGQILTLDGGLTACQ
ncbi:MAG: glucose 1-dehydrogenase [Thermoleophilia bacterium]|nr:glucose 1-dehydrogenase [Thermoleophilia bacterium]